jgi:uncharacterized protein
MLNYKELDNLLGMLESNACAADCHGFICGYICVNKFLNSNIWKEYLDIKSNPEVASSECLDDIETIVNETNRLLESEDFDFSLILPDDDTPISDRVTALSEWCHGFLNGIAHGEELNQTLEDEENKELIENITRICHLEVSDYPDESDEKALFELVEYVRMGAILIYSHVNSSLHGLSGSEAYH